MENREETEILLWDYIDGRCTQTEHDRISLLLATDAGWKTIYNDLLLLHTNAEAALAIEQPSLRFTKNVMEAIAQTEITPAIRKYIDTPFIKGIAAFFIVAITCLLGYALFRLDFSNISPAPVAGNMSGIQDHASLTGSIKMILVPVNIIIIMILADEYRKSRVKKANSQPL